MFEYRAELVRIIDGDTVEMKLDLGFHTFTVQVLRLWGINAPEKRGSSKAAGGAATEHLAMLLEKHAPLTVHTIQDKKGKYGRYLAIILGVDANENAFQINEAMVKDGHAVYANY